jgi:cytochrome c peroxidase
MQTPVALSDDEFKQLLAFLTNGLLDPKARPENLRKLIPARVPSGRPVHHFQP